MVKGHQQNAHLKWCAFLLSPVREARQTHRVRARERKRALLSEGPLGGIGDTRPRRTLAVRWVDVENRFEFQAVKPSCPLRKALIMLFRGELSEGR